MGKSTSDSGTKTTTSYDTKTSTTIGDIGFTGKDAIAFETALLQHNIASQQLAFNALNSLTTKMSSFNQSGAPSPTESEGDQSNTDKTNPPTVNYTPIILIGAVAVIAYIFLVR